jgi:hypothetical protein
MYARTHHIYILTKRLLGRRRRDTEAFVRADLAPFQHVQYLLGRPCHLVLVCVWVCVGMWVGADDAWTLSMCFDVCFDAQRRVPWVLRFRV